MLLCLRDDQAVLDVVAMIGSALEPGTLVCDLSSVHPRTVHTVRKALPDSIRLVDAPVMGSNDVARAGQLGLLSGGADTDVAAARAVLDHLGTVRHIGALGTGMALKAALMSGIIPSVTLIHDVITIGTSLGLTHQQIRDGLAASPLAPIAARAFSTTAEYPVALASKDLALTAPVEPLLLVPAASQALAITNDPTADLGAWAVQTG